MRDVEEDVVVWNEDRNLSQTSLRPKREELSDQRQKTDTDKSPERSYQEQKKGKMPEQQ
jgi:hypothetical protein